MIKFARTEKNGSKLTALADKCKFEHPSQGRGIPNGNRFASLQSPDHTNARSNGYQQGGASGPGSSVPFSLDKAQIVTDLSSEKPQWILSAYGPGRQAPAQLFGGPMREQSFEEMRLLHYMAVASGNPQQAVQEAEKLFQASEQQIHTALNDVDGAINFIINAQNEHPNRVDIVQGAQVSTSGSQPNPFGQPNGAQPTTSNLFSPPIQPTASAFGAPSQATAPAFGAPSGGPAFGQPPALGAKPNPFATPSAFGAPSQPSTGGAFGQPSQVGGGGAFGQPSQLGGGGAFGRPSQLGGGGAFGQPSQLGGGAFGQPSSLGQKPNPFGAPSGSSAFGGPSNATAAPFSAFANAPNPSSQETAPATTSVFGAPSQPTTSAPFGTAPQSASSNPFGQPSLQAPNPFGGASSAPFGAPSPAAKNPFAAVPPVQSQNNFGATPSAPNPFSSPQPNPPAYNPLGNPSASTPNSMPFGAPPPGTTQTGVNGNTGTTGHPPVSSYSSKDQSGRLTMFKGRRVVYQKDEPGVRNHDGSWSKIWFPDGAPPPYKDTEMDESAYDDGTKAAYAQMRQTGSFPGGVMPMLPPMREWCSWDF
ncbi:Nucleoporin [Lachnellula occidentalis]|uniref:Nucleoporin n=1 Tax=Lachnellula occidentalis TaxID=215460 RepID=A0A8H8UFS1_9HELO|nr:Nucleoporin [Lachnellula occidentalis]